jgi:hypothetical protein
MTATLIYTFVLAVIFIIKRRKSLKIIMSSVHLF